ncbi:LOW QUALITY PROTEIN: N-acylethanolamine-hydrolyzing acid amidase-like [Anableps anableps]
MFWTAELLLLLLLGLSGSLRAQLPPPPTVVINLDQEPELRWLALKKVFDVDYLSKAAAEIIEAIVPKWVHHAAIPVVKSLEKYMPQPYAGEIRGLASVLGGNLSDAIILNFAYEFTAFCTSVVAQDKNGNVFHGRNLDYPHPVQNMTVNLIFQKNGKMVYYASFAGYVGLWTGMSPNKFTVSGNQRGTEHWWNWWKNVVAFLFHRSPVSWLVREVNLEEAEDFLDAVMRLSKTPLITGVYYIVGGVRAGEGVVITRDRKGPADIWPLEPLNGGWYRVGDDFDHWLPPPAKDHRRETANKALKSYGQDHISMDQLYQVLSLYPVCNKITVYTTVMSAASPGNYTTVIRPEDCHD